MTPRLLIGTTAFLVLSGCGMPGPVGGGGAVFPSPSVQIPEGWGACNPSHIIEGPRRNVLIIPERGWLELPNEAAVLALSNGTRNDLGFLTIATDGAVSAVGGDLPSKLKLDYLVVEDANEAVGLGADLLIGYSLDNPIGSTGAVFALVEETDEAILLSVCSTEQTEELRQAAAAAGTSSVIEFVRRATDPTSPERALLIARLAKPAIEEVEEPTWYELDPDQRSLDPSDAPPEILDQLEWTFLLVRAPNAWNRIDGNLCPRIELGWAGICVATTLDIDLAVLNLAYQPGTPAELWLTTPPGQPFQALVRLAVIEPQTLAAMPAEGSILVELSGDPATIAEAETLTGNGGIRIQVVSAADVDSLIDLYLPKGQPVPPGQP